MPPGSLHCAHWSIASINSARLVRVFEQIKRDPGLARVVRTDNDVVIQPIQPGKPNQNAFIKRFNRTCREDVLDQCLPAEMRSEKQPMGG